MSAGEPQAAPTLNSLLRMPAVNGNPSSNPPNPAQQPPYQPTPEQLKAANNHKNAMPPPPQIAQVCSFYLGFGNFCVKLGFVLYFQAYP